MARSAIKDPLDRFSWTVSIDGFSKLGFTTCSVPGFKISTNKYAEGGSHLNPRNIIDSVEYRPVILTTGVTTDTSFAKWASGPFDLVQNNAALNEASTVLGITIPPAVANLGFGGPALVKSASSYPFNYRRNVEIEHLNRIGVVVVTYTLYGAFVVDYEPASDFSAKDDTEMSIGSITLAYDGFDVRYASLAGTLLNAALS